MIIGITGGRDVLTSQASLAAFAAWCVRLRVSVVRHGDCPLRKRRSDGQWTSVDRLVAQHLQRTTYIAVDPWPALWDRLPRHVAGFRRNGCMLSGDRSDWGREAEPQVERLVAWPGGPGTSDCRKQATKLGIRVIEAADIEAWHARLSARSGP